jgi:hypothetical protein
MVSAVSSQAATFNPPAVAAQTDEDATKQAASDTTVNDTDRGPATLVSFSQAAQDFSAAGLQWGQDRLAEVQAKSDVLHRQFEISKIDAQLTLLDQRDAMRDTNEASMKRLQAGYDKWLSSPISPEVTLNAEDAAKALKMLEDAGRTLPPLGPDMNYGFVKDGIQYNFHGDGTVTTRKEGIPTSEEDRMKGAASYRNMMDLIASQLVDNTEARTNLTAQRDALTALRPK